MKKQVLIFISTILFIAVFYEQEVGINLSFFALVLLGLNIYQKPGILKDKKAIVLALCVIFSSLSNAWLFTFTTFIAVIISSFVFRYYTVDPKLKLFSQALINVSNWFAAVVQVFQVDDWFEYDKEKPKTKFLKIFSYLILPFLILSIFFAIYVASSDMLSNWYNQFELDIDIVIFIVVAILGFYFSFVFWNAKIYDTFKDLDDSFRLNFNHQEKEQLKPTFGFLEIDFEKISGIITLICLNLMLFAFIIIFNVEHFQTTTQQLSEFSSKIHGQINSLIGSIVLAMLVILFYFKGALNFIQNNNYLVFLSKTWLALNGILVLSATIQNTIYIDALGLTYKRLGVYLFLILCVVGLFYSYQKIKLQKTNFYLIDKMSWAVFYSIMGCALFNWGNMVTRYNLTKENVDLYYLENSLKGNEKLLLDFYRIHPSRYNNEVKERADHNKETVPFLSSQLYYKVNRFD
ncbi:MAG TPA: DUF4153 domain-containing protein [Gelidibacter sp.]|uniref:DUF4153 domain-containing protein n=1 Tax=Gelidibacter sp. TaxID=2018083 RepID=UPI002BC6CDE5|nr:DUF4153 domain-containing protein [Gelidibacter sp.]HXJ97279.1 DUF4153 domain-containing protein [Gelidibacter sp.]